MSPRGGTGKPRYRPGIGQELTLQCPKCRSTHILGPREVKVGEEWCNCYACLHEWATNKKPTRKGDRPSWNPKVEAAT